MTRIGLLVGESSEMAVARKTSALLGAEADVGATAGAEAVVGVTAGASEAVVGATAGASEAVVGATAGALLAAAAGAEELGDESVDDGGSGDPSE
jgi:uncharacterized membrane protein